MSLVTLVVLLILVGVGLWLVNTQVTFIDAKIKTIINVVVIVVVVLFILNLMFDLNSLDVLRVPVFR